MKKRKPERVVLKGLLDGFFETGSEGTYWVLDTGEKDPIFIQPGDHLKIFDKDGQVVFDGKIIADRKTGWKQYPMNPDPKMGQQAVFRWDWYVHWIQKGWEPDNWAKLFIWHWFEEGRGVPQYRAELTQKKKSR